MNSLHLKNRFVDELPADPITDNSRRQVQVACYSLVSPTPVAAPTLLSYSQELAEQLDIDVDYCQSDEFLQLMAGNLVLPEMQPFAMCYGGHQFGQWAGQLGDGRAINLGEVVNQKGEYWALQLKGAGATPYSRTADGLAVLRSSIREYICSEAMYHLGVPTTRALSLVTTGEQVMRDIMYDGHPAYEPGAVVCRVAPSFLRFGSYQIFAARQELDELRQLVDFTIRHNFPHLLKKHKVKKHKADSDELLFAWFDEVCQLTIKMIVEWMRLGFVHGVMNTDNMSILGLTIDYGPYGWLDNFDPDWTPNTTDAQHRRYRYGQQPDIALWNCYQLANAIAVLVKDVSPLEQTLQKWKTDYQQQWNSMMAAKLGFANYQKGDEQLFNQLEALLSQVETDMTIFYRCLSKHAQPQLSNFTESYYQLETLDDDYRQALTQWLLKYQQRVDAQDLSSEQRLEKMQQVNPAIIFRNYLAQQAIHAAEKGNTDLLDRLFTALKTPYKEHAEFSGKRPEWARTKIGCSMLSCSS